MEGWSAPSLRRSASQASISAPSELGHPQARRQGARPGLGQGEPSEQFATPSPEQIREGDRMAKRHERGVDPVLQRGPVMDEMKPEAGPLALGPDRWVRQPDLRYC